MVLAAGLRAAVGAPGDAVDPLRAAITRCRAAGDTDGELGAIALLGRVAWWRGDVALLGELFPRVLELEAAEHRVARAIAGVGRALIADLEGDDDQVLDRLDAIEPGALDDAWEAMAAWLRATVELGRGDAVRAIAVLDAVAPASDPAFRLTVEGTETTARWALGHVDEMMAALDPLMERIRAAGVMQNVIVGLTQGAYALAVGGDVERARRYLLDAERIDADGGRGGNGRMALATAAVLLAEGDEAEAATVLREGGRRRRLVRRRRPPHLAQRPGHDLRAGPRPPASFWDTQPLRGRIAHMRELSSAVLAARDARPLPDVDVSDPALVRANLHHRFAVELALALEAAGRPEGGALLEELGPAGRDAVREVAGRRSRQTRPAKSLLAAVPAPPPHTTGIGTLGPLEIERDGEPVTDPDLRRERVRALLAYLVSHRTTTRAAILTALWPDLDERAAANNLRVTLNYLLRLLEPWRDGRRVRLLRAARRAGRHPRHRRAPAHRRRPVRRPRRPGRPGRGRRHPVARSRAPPGRGRAVPGRAARRRPRRRVARCSTASTTAPGSWPRPPGPASCCSVGAIPTRPSRWPAAPSTVDPWAEEAYARARGRGPCPGRPLGRPPDARPRRWPRWPTSASSRRPRPAGCDGSSAAAEPPEVSRRR